MSIDAHFHLDSDIFSTSIDDIIKESKENSIDYLLTSADSIDSCKRIVPLCKKYKNLYSTVGIHPHEASKHITRVKELKEFLFEDKVVGIGEIGLDFHYNFSSKENQYQIFREQLTIAEENKLPVVIHARQAEEEVLKEILKFNIKNVFFHCFAGTISTAEKILSHGYLLGITGIVTFKNNGNISEILKLAGLDNILTETDSPYLAPIPYRGKTNYPKYINIIEEKIAEILGNDISVKDVSKKVKENFRNFFNID